MLEGRSTTISSMKKEWRTHHHQLDEYQGLLHHAFDDD